MKEWNELTADQQDALLYGIVAAISCAFMALIGFILSKPEVYIAFGGAGALASLSTLVFAFSVGCKGRG